MKQYIPIELNDGVGSYFCEYGHIHDYSKFDFEAVERELANPTTKVYATSDDMWADLNADDE